MKTLPALLASLTLAAVTASAATLDETLQTAAADYRARVARAAEELNRTRARIDAEKAPLLARLRTMEDRVVAAQSELTRLETRRADSTEMRRKLLQEIEATRKVTTYAATLAHDALKAATDGLAPGETERESESLQALLQRLDDSAAGANGTTALEVAEQLLARTERALGGYRADGQAVAADTSELLRGQFAFVGPEVFFRSTDGRHLGAVRARDGAKLPASYALPEWSAEAAAALFAGQPGAILADASGGKALRLQETSGTLWDHVRKGGVVAFAILGVGALALIMILQKIRDVAQMGLEPAESYQKLLALVARGARPAAEASARSLQASTRELVLTGLRSAAETKIILEERLQSVLLAQRLHFERRLPLLAVIATAAPLMGLLGTVVGMVKTFALITVFGTGNAGKLSSGISEVLVATELGLAVAIPTLIAHGFLAHRIQKNLLLLERQALEFTTAVEVARTAGQPAAVNAAS